MKEKIVVERLRRVNAKAVPAPTPAQMRMAALEMEKAIDERIKRKANGESVDGDDFEVITEWL